MRENDRNNINNFYNNKMTLFHRAQYFSLTDCKLYPCRF